MSNATNRCRIFSLLLKKTQLQNMLCFFPSHCFFLEGKAKKWRYLHEEVSFGVIENRFFMSTPNNAIFPTFACPKKTTEIWFFFFSSLFYYYYFRWVNIDAVNGMRVAKLKNHSEGIFHFFMHIKNPPQKWEKKYCDMPFAIRDEYFQRNLFYCFIVTMRESWQ